ncbi:MAG: 50S ribosomal protein L9 [Planctomycetota bacterium]|nr:MAG: 50S ribosomal protein L9 [Planctomycetota bacterium]
MKTRVILRKDIPSLGQAGEVVSVEPGYARNYLIPMNLAFAHTADGLKRVEKDRKVAEAERLAQMKAYEDIVQALNKVQLTFEEKVSEEGHLYGSVSAHAIAAAIAEQGITSVHDRDVRLPEPLKQVGEYQIQVHVHGELEATVKVWVVAKQAQEA